MSKLPDSFEELETYTQQQRKYLRNRIENERSILKEGTARKVQMIKEWLRWLGLHVKGGRRTYKKRNNRKTCKRYNKK